MTVVCGGGASQAKPGQGQQVVFTAAAIESALILLGMEPVAAVLAPLLASVTFDLTTFCATDPPADPGLTGADVIAAVNYTDPINQGAAVQKVYQWFKSWYWYQACQCASNITPAAPTLSNPGSPLSNDGGLPSSPTTAPCWDTTSTFSVDAFNNPQIPWPTALWPDPVFGPNVGTHRIYGGTPTRFRATFVSHLDGHANMPTQQGIQLTWRNSSTGPLGTFDSGFKPAGTVAVVDMTPPATADQVAVSPYYTSSVSGLDDWTNTLTVTMWCAGQSANQLTPNCCPPDPTLENKLNQLLAGITLIQRQLAPFAYVHGPVHSALTGNGEIAVSGLLGMKIAPASIPSSAGIVSGDPDSLWLDSWIRWGNADGWSERQFLTSSPFVSLPALASQYTKIGYTLRPGLTVDATELVREP